MDRIRAKAGDTLGAAQSLINRSYLAELESYPVQPFQETGPAFNSATDMRVFRVERIVQNNKQSVLESTTAAYTALGAAGYSVFLILKSDGRETDLYIGTRGSSGRTLGEDAGKLLQETFKGHFPGSKLRPQNQKNVVAMLEVLQASKDSPSSCVTSVTGVPALSTENREHFMQGLERFIDAAEGRAYNAIILAESISSQNLDLIRAGYEQVATQLSPLMKQQLSFSEQESESVGLSISKNLSESLGESLGLTETKGNSSTETTGNSESLSAQTAAAKATSIIAGATAVGTSLLPGLGSGVGFAVGFGAQAIATAFAQQKTTGTNHSASQSTSTGESTARTSSTTKTTGTTDTESLNRTLGSTKQVSIDTTNKGIEQLLARIDHHLARIDEAKTYGGWNAAAYFIGDSQASSESLASIFLGLIRGSKSSHENFALSTWNGVNKNYILDWLATFSHPQLKTNFVKNVPINYVTPATLVSGKELAIQLSLPRSSTSTVSVVTTETFGRKVQRLDESICVANPESCLQLGNVRHLWENLPQRIALDLDNLTSHVFVCGSTGSGKSNTLYGMLDQISEAGIPFLVIEPAKGEYKHVFGQRDGVTVLGTNPHYTELLRINPFRFPTGIHVLEHIDRLIEIFNICWPMYAAMPAVLKDATLKAYRNNGWDLDESVNLYGEGIYPGFIDLLQALEQVIEKSAYSQEVKGNYIGSLSTRVESLTNGLNGQIFNDDEVGDELLFNSQVIVDLSRVGSSETKALIMGLLVMRLSEYRMAQGGMNQPLRHVTVIEEAHNILRNNLHGGGEGAGVAAKAVEMLTNAIAEMRTYGEGFVIVDQSPSAVDIAAIRNTNTKVILRLPEGSDRQLIGKSVALRDEQLDEIAKLPKGVAIVYQNDWLEPVMCQIDRFAGEERPYLRKSKESPGKAFNREVLKLLLRKRVTSLADISMIEEMLPNLRLKEDLKGLIRNELDNLASGPDASEVDDFQIIAEKVVRFLGCREYVRNLRGYVGTPRLLVEALDAKVRALVGDVTPGLRLSAQQCMLDSSVRLDDGNLDVYRVWREEVDRRVSYGVV